MMAESFLVDNCSGVVYILELLCPLHAGVSMGTMRWPLSTETFCVCSRTYKMNDAIGIC